jgi:hypothetical protein
MRLKRADIRRLNGIPRRHDTKDNSGGWKKASRGSFHEITMDSHMIV